MVPVQGMPGDKFDCMDELSQHLGQSVAPFGGLLEDVATFVTLWNQPGNGGASNDGSGQGSEVRKQRSEESATDVRGQGRR